MVGVFRSTHRTNRLLVALVKKYVASRKGELMKKTGAGKISWRRKSFDRADWEALNAK